MQQTQENLLAFALPPHRCLSKLHTFSR